MDQDLDARFVVATGMSLLSPSSSYRARKSVIHVCSLSYNM